MDVDKLVDSAVLDASLGYTAARIRAKTGGSAQILFDTENQTGFGDAVDAIPSGGSGLDYDVQTKTLSSTSGSMTVDREFTNFILIAFLENEPTTAPTANYTTAFICVYVNEKYYIPSHKTFAVQYFNSTFRGVSSNQSKFSVGPTSITVSGYTSYYSVTGDWKIVQIEIPNSIGMYSWIDALASITGGA